MPKAKACKVCGEFFERRSMSHIACSPKCAIELTTQKRIKVEKKQDKDKLISLQPLEYWLKIAERHCNAYIRARDPDLCISCGVTKSSAWQAGHYISVGANRTLRFNEDNIHKQCIKCNMHLASNAVYYRIGLVEKIGLERVEFLEGWHAPVKMTREQAQQVAEVFKRKLKELKGK